MAQRARIFTALDAGADIGDYFRIPYAPVMRVSSKLSLDGKVFYTLVANGGETEYWEMIQIALDDRGSGRLEKVAA